MSWLSRNTAQIEAIAASVTALVAVLALAGVALQLRVADDLGKAQSARDIYREFVALSVARPELAKPDYCALKSDPAQHTAYEYYVEYLLYTAEQSLGIDPEWRPVFEGHLSHHQSFLCQNPDWTGDIAAVANLIEQTRRTCPQAPACP